MDAETKLRLIKEALHCCINGEFSELSFVVIVGMLVDPQEITADDMKWALEKANSIQQNAGHVDQT